MAVRPGRLTLFGLGAAVMLLITGCPSTGGAADSTLFTGAAGGGSVVSTPTGSASSAIPASPADVRAVESLVASINNTAGGPVATQQALLMIAVHPDFTAAQQACAAATITIKLDPVLADLTAAPGWAPAESTAPESTVTDSTVTDGGSRVPRGTLYRVPALIEVYTAGRRTGTDMTTLRIAVLDGTAHTFPICLV